MLELHKFISPGGDNSPVLRELRRAIIEGKTASFLYQARHDAQPEPRVASLRTQFSKADCWLSSYSSKF